MYEVRFLLEKNHVLIWRFFVIEVESEAVIEMIFELMGSLHSGLARLIYPDGYYVHYILDVGG